MKNRRGGKRVQVRDLSKDRQLNFAIVAKQVGLTAKQERVLRMRKGVSVPPDQELEFRGKDNAITRRHLAKMERDIIRRTGPRPPQKPHPDLA